MEKHLISIHHARFPSQQLEAVNARELHQFLEVGRDFTNWIKTRIESYKFKKNQDFIVFAKTGENPKGGRPPKEYHLTLDMAKELSMVERTERGRQARRYFIECERKLREGKQPQIAHQEHPALPATDSVLLFINQRCEFGPYDIRKDALFGAYRQFCETRGYLPERRNIFFRKLYTHARLGKYRPCVDGGYRERRIKGIRLIESPHDGQHKSDNTEIGEEIQTIMSGARTTTTKISPNDLALLKIGRDIMNQIWQRFLPDEPRRSITA